MAEEAPIEDDVKKKVILRPPNRRRYDEQMEQLIQTIRGREAELKSLGRPQLPTEGSSEDLEDKEALLREQKECREQKDVAINKRKALDDKLKTMNEDISKQSDSLSKLEAGLTYKTETAVDDAIQKLQYQLRTRHFKLTEENRIVKEIDSLVRSKKKAKEYLQQKELIKIQRDKKKSMKDARDKYFHQVLIMRGKEDEVKQRLMRSKNKADEAWSRYREAGPERDALKKEIDELYERRRQLSLEFKKLNGKYHTQQKQQRADSFKRKGEEKRAFEEARKREWAVYEASREPYEDERQLCSALIKYLQRYLIPDHDLPLGASALSPGQSPSGSLSSSMGSRDEKMNPEGGEFVILKKKSNGDDDVFLPVTSAKKKRAIRKHNRKSSWLSKPIRHTAPIFSQFDQLGLQAPSSVGEVPDAISQLKVKKDEYDEIVRRETKPVTEIPSGANSYSLSIHTRQETLTNSSALDQVVSSVAVLNISHDQKEHLINSVPKEITQDRNLLRIDIQSVQAHCIQRQTNNTPGMESAPETPNSGSSQSRDNDGDLDIKDVESIDSGIGIHRLKSCVSIASSLSTNNTEDIKCSDPDDAMTTSGEIFTQDALLQDSAAFLERHLVSIPTDTQAQFDDAKELPINLIDHHQDA